MFFACHSIHLSVIAGFSLDLFLNIYSFDKNRLEGTPCADVVKVFLFGHPTSMSAHGLRLTGVGISSIMLTPGLNLLFVLAMHDSLLCILHFATFPIAWIGCAISAYFGGYNFREAVGRPRDVLFSAPETVRGILLAFLPIVVPFCANALIITVLEGTIRVNRPFITPGEGQWQYSQILVLSQTIMQLYGAGRVLWGAWKNKSEYGILRESSVVNISSLPMLMTTNC
jgi:hypothetical protein